MGIPKPYPRIFIQQIGESVIEPVLYSTDSRYVEELEKHSLLSAANIIVEDFIRLCEYIEPVDDNKHVFSHRTYELLLRVATEFEANCKGIIEANNYQGGRNLNITDYHKLNSVMLLSEFEVETSLWRPTKRFQPLMEWDESHKLSWYKAYNNSKHNRYANFGEASLENVFNGICSLVALLAAQFPNDIGLLAGDNIRMSSYDAQSIIIKHFTIKYPERSDENKYDFDWEQLNASQNPFESYQF